MTQANIVVAMTGASGAIYAVRLLEVLLAAGRQIHLSISPSAIDDALSGFGVHVTELPATPDRIVRWISERTEDFVSSTHGRDYTAIAQLALDEQGRFLALDVRAVANIGAYLSSNGPLSPTSAAASRRRARSGLMAKLARHEPELRLVA